MPNEKVRRIITEIAAHLNERPPEIPNREETRDLILATLHGEGVANARYAVEGARVMCTQMPEGSGVSRMRKLTDEERKRNTEAKGEARDNPDWNAMEGMPHMPNPIQLERAKNPHMPNPIQLERAKGAPRVNPLARQQQHISADHMPRVVHPSDRRRAAFFNQKRLLDKMDITFEPLFGMARPGPFRELTESEPQSLTFNRSSIMNVPSAHQHFGTAMFNDSRCGTCTTSDDGKCCPDIEDLMWKGLDDSGTGNVNLAEYRTLLQNSAYMFCHHGQGLLYLDDSGQELDIGVEVELHALTGMDRDGRLTSEQQLTNALYIYNFLSAQGWTREAIAAFLGNMMKESYLNPGVWENGSWGESGFNPWTTGQQSGFGLIQITPSELFLNFTNLTAIQVMDLADTDPQRLINFQLEFFVHRATYGDANGGGVWLTGNARNHHQPSEIATVRLSFQEFITSTLTPEQLAYIIHSHYVRSNDTPTVTGERAIYARFWYNQLP